MSEPITVTCRGYSHTFKSVTAATDYLIAHSIHDATATIGKRKAEWWNGEWRLDGCQCTDEAVALLKRLKLKAPNHYPFAGGGPTLRCEEHHAEASLSEIEE